MLKKVSDVRSEDGTKKMSYKEYMRMLKTELPVSEYLLEPKTAVLGALFMFSIPLVVYLVFPLYMFQNWTLPLWLLTVAVFLGVSWLYYNNVYYPNEIGDYDRSEADGGD
jgi:hypothetical protein